VQVVITGGGTGGHLFPALAVREALVERRPEARVLFVGASGGVDCRQPATRSLRVIAISSRHIRPSIDFCWVWQCSYLGNACIYYIGNCCCVYIWNQH
jgi:UDP-N-acetylglucosamine:LPS N-acetylglucosamine transferase